MKIIDFHTHFFPDKLFDAIWKWFHQHAWPIQYQKYADDLIAILKKEGATKVVALHYPHKEGMTNSLNEWIYKLGQKYNNFIIPFGSLHPADKNKKNILKACFENYQFKGLKFHCHVQQFSPDDSRMEPVYERCNAEKKIILIHSGTGPHFKERPTIGYGYDVSAITGVKRFEKVLKKYPDITFVVPHMGYEEIDEFVGLLTDHPNLYLDTTMVVAGYFPVKVKREWLNEHSDKILFGTDFPNIPYEWKRERDQLKTLKLGDEKEAGIFYQNAAALLGIL